MVETARQNRKLDNVTNRYKRVATKYKPGLNKSMRDSCAERSRIRVAGSGGQVATTKSGCCWGQRKRRQSS